MIISKCKRLIKDQFYGTENFVINWDNFKKGILLLIFCATIQICATIWYVICYYIPVTKQWLDLDFFWPRMIWSCICITVNLAVLWLGYRYRCHSSWRTFIEFFSPLFFGLTMVYSSYTLGVYSPVTLAGLVNFMLLGLVFYERKILYMTTIPVMLFIVVVCYLSSMGYVRYAPAFSEQLNNSILHKNWFWIFTMLQLYLPILLVSIFLFETLLSQWRKRENQIDQLSKMDALTGVFNRRFVGSFIGTLNEQQYALILMDLDFFKNVNDCYGHDVGDKVLCRVAEVLSANVRGNDIVGRYGGEEFVMVLPATSIGEAHMVAERCRKQIEMEIFITNGLYPLKVSASFGITMSSDQLSAEQVMKQADQALYVAKEKGRNQVRCFGEFFKFN